MNLTLPRRIALGVFALAVQAAQAADAICPAPNSVEVSMQDKIAILSNLKRVIDEEQLLRSDFYSEPSLSAFFRASGFRWGTYLPVRHVSITHFGNLYEVAEKYTGTEIDINFRPGETDNTVASANFIIPRLDSALNASALIAAFGDRYVIEENQGSENLRDPYLIEPATTPFGNKVITYRFTGKTSETELSASIGADGVINNLGINQKVIK